MSTIIRLPGNLSKGKIALETRKNTPIINQQSFEFSSYERNQFNKFKTDYPHARIRCEPNPIYNCHGMTFASRRTSIFDSSEITKIIEEDGYTVVSELDLMPGDIILYFETSGDCEHSGIVIEVPSRNKGTFWIPTVCSKWGKAYEFIHLANYCPYNYANVKYYRITKGIL